MEKSGTGTNFGYQFAKFAGRNWYLLGVSLLVGLIYLFGPTVGSSAVLTGAAIPVEMVVPEGKANDYWPFWRGPGRQGLVKGRGYPDKWSDTENVLWKVEVPGLGNSSPIIWGDKIFLTTAYRNGERRSVLSFRRSDGKLLWEFFAPDANPEKAHPKNGAASGTSATDGERVYAYFGNHGLMAVDYTGNLIWHRPFAEMNAYHGTTCSPLLYKDRVIIYQDHRGSSVARSFVAAFDKSTGRTIWWKDRQENTGWGSPIAIRAGERDEIIVSSQKRVYAYDPNSGEELWSCGGNLSEVIPTPVVGHDLLFCSSGRSGPTLAIRPGGAADVTETHVVWKSHKGSPFVPSPLLYGDYLYMVNDMLGIATCYEAKTGKLMWQGRMGEAQREGFSASPVGVEGKVFFMNDRGETFVLKAGSEFKLLHVNRLHARTIASPALVDGRWYIRTDRHLICVGS